MIIVTYQGQKIGEFEEDFVPWFGEGERPARCRYHDGHDLVFVDGGVEVKRYPRDTWSTAGPPVRTT